MATATLLKERALSLAMAQTDREEALRELEETSEGHRVAAVLARRKVSEEMESGSAPPAADVAIELLDELLVRLPA